MGKYVRITENETTVEDLPEGSIVADEGMSLEEATELSEEDVANKDVPERLRKMGIALVKFEGSK